MPLLMTRSSGVLPHDVRGNSKVTVHSLRLPLGGWPKLLAVRSEAESLFLPLSLCHCAMPQVSSVSATSLYIFLPCVQRACVDLARILSPNLTLLPTLAYPQDLPTSVNLGKTFLGLCK